MDYAELKERMAEIHPEMTGGQIAAGYAAGEEVDYIPFSIQSNEEAMANVFGYTTAQWRNDPEVHADVIKRRRDEFGIAGLAAGLRLRTVAQALGTVMFFPEIGIDRVDKPVLTDLSGLKDLAKIDPYTNPVYLAIIERGKFLKDRFPDMGIGTSATGPITNASCVRPTELVLRDMVKHPEELKELLKIVNYNTLAFMDMFVKEFGGAACTICDPVSCADILGRKKYLEFSEPYLEELIAGLTEIHGRKPGIHICGKTNPLWEDMTRLKVASFSVDNSEDLSKARDIMGPHFGLVGNVAPVDVMLNGTIDDVIEACKSCITKGSEAKNGYTLGTGCQVPIGTPRENFDAFIYAAKKYGRGAKKGCLPKGIIEEE